MAPNKRKKKVNANPARGFATTSVPSKTKETQVEEQDTDLVGPNQAPSLPNVSNEQNDKLTKAEPAQREELTIQEMTPDMLEAHLEDAELQNIIDTHATRCKADASRQVNRLEIERRQLRTQSHRLATASWLSDEVVDAIIERCAEATNTTHHRVSVPSSVDQQDLLLRLWPLRRTLLALGFSDIDLCIQYTLELYLNGKLQVVQDQIWGLQDALEWYATHGRPADLPDYESGTVASNIRDKEMGKSESVEDDQPQASNDNPKPTSAPSIEVNTEADVILSPLPSSGSDDEDPSTFIEAYVRLQTLLFDMERRMQDIRSPLLNTRKSRLLDKLGKLRRDPLFDEYAADVIWLSKLRDLEIETAQAKKSKSKPQEDWKAKKREKLAADADQDLLGGIFGEETTISEDNENENGSIELVDFGRWSGVQPRKLLEDSCRVLDAGHKVRFTTLSTTKHSTRQKLDLTWSLDQELDQLAIDALPEVVHCSIRPRMLTIEMQKIAASTPNQAESYVSTLALFVLSCSGIGDSKQYSRLPTIWKSLYRDIEDSFKQLIQKQDKDTLKDLRSRIRGTIESQESSALNGVYNPKYNRLPLAIQSKQNTSKLSTDEAIAMWTSRMAAQPYQKMLQIRKSLPVHGFKQEVLQAIQQNQLTVICADTGAGKSTQIPSFVLEHELSNGRDCRILVTQPRRISAISLAKRVSQELGEGRNDLGTDRSLVGYAIRLESKTSRSTRITYATTGVLLRMFESTPDLENIDFLILDEVHERTMDLDLLFIALRKLRERRSGFKIILMSATIDAEKFSRYFGGAPILNVPGRTFPVEVKYLEDAIEDTLDLTSSHSHRDLESEDNESTDNGVDRKEMSLETLQGYSNKTKTVLAEMDEYRIDYDLVANLAMAIATKPKYKQYSRAILIFMPGISEIRRIHNVLISHNVFEHGWNFHLLHSSFSMDDLEQAFASPPPGFRKVVIATNIAETGITIPDITAVIDTCKEKIMRFDERRQLSKLTEGFISQSSARQRRGRAARVQEGLCFHLVTKRRYEHIMLEQHVPEMLRLSLQEPILRIKVWNLGSIEETLSAAIDPPTHKNIHRAIERLKDAGALDSSENLTALGKRLARLPLEVILGKLAVFGIVFKCLDSVITIIAILTSKPPFLSTGGLQNESRLPFSKGDSDLISTLNAYQSWRKATDAGTAHQYCRKNHLSNQNLSSIEDQKIQLLVYLVDADLLQLTSEEKAALNRARTSGNRRAFFAVPARFTSFDHDRVITSIIALAFYPRVLVREGRTWRNVYTNQHVSLRADSVNRVTEKPLKWLSFFEAMQTKTGNLNVLETSKIPEPTIAILMGEAEFRFFSGIVSVDKGKIRFCLRQWRQLAAVKALRECLADVMQRCWNTPGLAMPASDQGWIDIFAALVIGQHKKTT